MHAHGINFTSYRSITHTNESGKMHRLCKNGNHISYKRCEIVELLLWAMLT